MTFPVAFKDELDGRRVDCLYCYLWTRNFRTYMGMFVFSLWLLMLSVEDGVSGVVERDVDDQ